MKTQVWNKTVGYEEKILTLRDRFRHFVRVTLNGSFYKLLQNFAGRAHFLINGSFFLQWIFTFDWRNMIIGAGWMQWRKYIQEQMLVWEMDRLNIFGLGTRTNGFTLGFRNSDSLQLFSREWLKNSTFHNVKRK